MGIDKYEFSRFPANQLSGVLGYTPPRDKDLVNYLRTKVSANPDEIKMYAFIKKGRDSAYEKNTQGHHLYKYADVFKREGIEASNKAIENDIKRLRADIFGLSYVEKHPVSLLDKPADTTDLAPVVTAGGSDMLSKKNMMIAGGAVAAIALGFMLLK